ncbi:uncharacterized protein C8A04DRAFT_12389 [Dichotomopilus funicola]|uniref:C3H1-type domain-containing protein n=1 Tax=Dichotomopilus funicola TaxID=1934379 RepID=A0AAN6V265_9PEZI|nr:hypothetical protein C8A04DRAFT_12389 [Dichotomopilus funicola]
MLSDQAIEQAAAKLAAYQRNDALSQLLEEYAVLIDNYKRLKSDYEEERDSREKYKQMAKDQERNPFVLVLVDGDGYLFNDTYLSQRSEGGGPAAQALNDEIKASLRRKGLEHCEVMIRIYANVFGLSKVLSKTGVVGADSRSMAPFIAGFNKSYGLTEFIDAGQLKENADFKLRAMLRLYADNSQCKHIYFAACHDVGYISELTPYMGHSSKFTLIDTPSVRFHDEFHKLGMGIEEFRSVFRHAPLDSSAAYRSVSNGSNASPVKPVSGPGRPASPIKTPSAVPPTHKDEQKTTNCLFYSLGKCRYGKTCKLLHVNPPGDPKTNNSHQHSDTSSPPSPSAAKHNPSLSPDTHPSHLPQVSSIPRGQVMVNVNNHRLDPLLRPVKPELVTRLKSRIDKRRVCNSFQLRRACDAGDNCEYDHEPIEPELLPALWQLARSQPCVRRGGCRASGCVNGHVCQNTDCKHRGGKSYCRLPFLAHLEPFVDVRFIPGAPKPVRKGIDTGSVEGSSSSGL